MVESNPVVEIHPHLQVGVASRDRGGSVASDDSSGAEAARQACQKLILKGRRVFIGSKVERTGTSPVRHPVKMETPYGDIE